MGNSTSNSATSYLGERLLAAARRGDTGALLQSVRTRQQLQPEDLEARNKSGRTPLLLACKHGHPDLAIQLIRLGADVNAAEDLRPEEKRKPTGNTILHYACKLRSSSLVDLLLDKGANPFVWNSTGTSALDVARMVKNWEVALVLRRRLAVMRGWVQVDYHPLLSREHQEGGGVERKGLVVGSSGWQGKQFCLVLQSGCPDALELLFFDSESAAGEATLLRTFHVNSIVPPQLLTLRRASSSSSKQDRGPKEQPKGRKAVRIEVGEWALRPMKNGKLMVMTDRTETRASGALTLLFDDRRETERWFNFFKEEAKQAAARPLSSSLHVGINLSSHSSVLSAPVSAAAPRYCRVCKGGKTKSSGQPCQSCRSRRSHHQPRRPSDFYQSRGRESSSTLSPRRAHGQAAKGELSGDVHPPGSNAAFLAGETEEPEPESTPFPFDVSAFQPKQMKEEELMQLAIERSLPSVEKGQQVVDTPPLGPPPMMPLAKKLDDEHYTGAGGGPQAIMKTVSGGPAALSVHGAEEEEAKAGMVTRKESKPDVRRSEKAAGEEGEILFQGGEECLVCFGAFRTGICVPCGHNVACMDCLTEVKQSNGLCPYCRQEIREAIRLYKV